MHGLIMRQLDQVVSWMSSPENSKWCACVCLSELPSESLGILEFSRDTELIGCREIDE